MSGVQGMKCITKVRPPRLEYRVRQLTYGNQTGDAFGITIPASIAKQFSGVTLKLIINGSGFSFVMSGVQ